ncbi:AraC-type DNA-binding protein [Microbulbifer thermotolerans]|uniref:AraC family transcriptional regulator n=1 Tax=Microbulbifer thermotolerans TaxID=252514 RepID=UPI0008E403F6|nr:AraC family transcriptional regulator [Microbulbifer thermotolerans]SFC85598.1 AraC-type DNA-binding protein [Microbulbifer thermotolerans]
MEPTYEIRSGALAGFTLLVPRLGGDPAALLARVGLPADCMRRPDLLIPIATLTNLLNLCAEELECSDFGLRLANMQGVRILGALGKLVLDCVDLRRALAVTQRYMALHNQAEHWRIRVERGRVLARRFDHFRDTPAAAQYRDLSLGAGYRLIRDLAGEDIRPLQVHFRQGPVSTMQQYRDFFHIEPQFGQPHDCLVFSADIMQRPLRTPGDSLERYFDEFTQQLLEKHRGSLAAQVRALILQTLGAQRHSLTQISRLIGIPSRTLQRHLQQEGTGFKQLLQDARMETARWHLCASNIDINLLSAVLGYTEISAFSKAFRTAHGLSPLQWRKKQREKD